MDFYFDEQLPKIVANALNVIETHEGVNRVFSTEIEFGDKGRRPFSKTKESKWDFSDP
jgi:hypothetical protein